MMVTCLVPRLIGSSSSNKGIVLFVEKAMSNKLGEISRRWPSHVAEKFVPTSYWDQDANANEVLRIHLPGFRHDEVRIELASDNSHIKIEGERILNEQQKCLYIDEAFPLPKNSDLNNIIAKFEGQHLLVTVPRRSKKDDESESGDGNGSSTSEEEQNSNVDDDDNVNYQSKPADEHEQAHHGNERHDSNELKTGGRKSTGNCSPVSPFPEATIRKWEEYDNPILGMGMECLKRNKVIVLAIVISFSVGVLLSNVWTPSLQNNRAI